MVCLVAIGGNLRGLMLLGFFVWVELSGFVVLVVCFCFRLLV